jgi:hypothetical protein
MKLGAEARSENVNRILGTTSYRKSISEDNVVREERDT